jgi:hypothetical protein
MTKGLDDQWDENIDGAEFPSDGVKFCDYKPKFHFKSFFGGILFGATIMLLFVWWCN